MPSLTVQTENVTAGLTAQLIEPLQGEKDTESNYPFILPSSQDRGSRRLLPDDGIEVQAGEKIISVIPIDRSLCKGKLVCDI